jgi:hypothetical protein
MKLASNTLMYHRMQDEMDVNCDVIIDGEATIEEMAGHFRTDWEETKSEGIGVGENEFVPWRSACSPDRSGFRSVTNSPVAASNRMAGWSLRSQRTRARPRRSGFSKRCLSRLLM